MTHVIALGTTKNCQIFLLFQTQKIFFLSFFFSFQEKRKEKNINRQQTECGVREIYSKNFDWLKLESPVNVLAGSQSVALCCFLERSQHYAITKKSFVRSFLSFVDPF